MTAPKLFTAFKVRVLLSEAGSFTANNHLYKNSLEMTSLFDKVSNFYHELLFLSIIYCLTVK